MKVRLPPAETTYFTSRRNPSTALTIDNIAIALKILEEKRREGASLRERC